MPKTLSLHFPLDQLIDKDEKGMYSATWVVLHNIACAFPEVPTAEDCAAVTSFVQSLCVILPCTMCRSHFKQELAQFPIRCESRAALCQWVFDLHNRVNARLGKPVLTRKQGESIQNVWNRISWSKLANSIQTALPQLGEEETNVEEVIQGGKEEEQQQQQQQQRHPVCINWNSLLIVTVASVAVGGLILWKEQNKKNQINKC